MNIKEFQHLEREMRELNMKYEQVQQAIKLQNKVRWTLDLIKKLQEYEIGNPERLSEIKLALQEDRDVGKDNKVYLKEKYTQLMAVLETGYDTEKI